MRDFVSTGQAGHVLGVSRERIIDYIRDGRLRVAARDGFGRRLLLRNAVEDLRAERERAKKSSTQRD